MFGKNYDKDIASLYKSVSNITEMQNKSQKTFFQMIKDLQKLINNFEGSLLEIAKVQKSHKEAIMLLSKR